MTESQFCYKNWDRSVKCFKSKTELLKNREKNTESLDEVIRRLLKSYKLDHKYDEQVVIAAWKDTLGTLISAKTRDISLKDGVLYVSLESSVIRRELGFAKDQVMDQLNEAVGRKLVKKIELR